MCKSTFRSWNLSSNYLLLLRYFSVSFFWLFFNFWCFWQICIKLDKFLHYSVPHLIKQLSQFWDNWLLFCNGWTTPNRDSFCQAHRVKVVLWHLFSCWRLTMLTREEPKEPKVFLERKPTMHNGMFWFRLRKSGEEFQICSDMCIIAEKVGVIWSGL